MWALFPLTADTVLLWQLQGNLTDSANNLPTRTFNMNTHNYEGYEVYGEIPGTGGLLGFVPNGVQCVEQSTGVSGSSPLIPLLGEFTIDMIAQVTLGTPDYTFVSMEDIGSPYSFPYDFAGGPGGTRLNYHDSFGFKNMFGTPFNDTAPHTWTFRRRSTGGSNLAIDAWRDGVHYGDTVTTTTPVGPGIFRAAGDIFGRGFTGHIASVRVRPQAVPSDEIVEDHLYVLSGGATQEGAMVYDAVAGAMFGNALRYRPMVP